uniref:Ribonuclease H-like domain-containing protein n=1 Tax=Tanacetum cinerariifolium TaxID=118510 RepID=A0A699H0G6_TANCI|nr:ribonuclease H-like domain-containing protein [Tanacetum cinerariifolium]
MSLHGYIDDEFNDVDDNNVTLISRLDMSNPLHLHPNDSVALTVVSVKLKGTENYHIWSCPMLLALEGKNKSGFIDGSCKRAKHVWEELKETDDKVDGFVTFSLHHKIHTLSQNGSSIADYYHKLNVMWKQFDALIELPRCTCHAADDFKKHNQLMKLKQFLMGLDDAYMQIKSSILSRETLPDVRSACTIISSEESHMVAFGSLYGTSQRPSNENRPNDNRNKRTARDSALVCKNCGFNSHTIDICFKIIRYPIDFGFEGRKNSGDRLGHPANQVLDVSKSTLNFDNKESDLMFDTCQRAKQTREPFTLSDHILSSSVLNGKSPFDLVYNKPLSLKDLRSFGCLAYATILNSHEKFGSSKVDTSIQDINHLNFFNTNTLYDLLDMPNDEERRNPDSNRHDDSPSNNTLELADLPVERKTIGSKWVFKIKYKFDGEIERFKARLVAKGFNQKERIDFDETFSHVVKIVTVRCLINLAMQSGWSLFQMDINNAFLYGDLNEYVYMTFLPGYFSTDETKVCKLNKSLYGLNQAPRQWNAKLTSALLENDFLHSKSDYSLFTKSFGGVFIALLVYADDIIITENNLLKINKVKQFLKKRL